MAATQMSVHELLSEVYEALGDVSYGIELKVRGQAAGSQWKLVRFETRACCCISQTHR